MSTPQIANQEGSDRQAPNHAHTQFWARVSAAGLAAAEQPDVRYAPEKAVRVALGMEPDASLSRYRNHRKLTDAMREARRSFEIASGSRVEIWAHSRTPDWITTCDKAETVSAAITVQAEDRWPWCLAEAKASVPGRAEQAKSGVTHDRYPNVLLGAIAFQPNLDTLTFADLANSANGLGPSPSDADLLDLFGGTHDPATQPGWLVTRIALRCAFDRVAAGVAKSKGMPPTPILMNLAINRLAHLHGSERSVGSLVEPYCLIDAAEAEDVIATMNDPEIAKMDSAVRSALLEQLAEEASHNMAVSDQSSVALRKLEVAAAETTR